MQSQSPQPPNLRERVATTASWFGFVCQILEASVAVFLRQNFGTRYLGVQAIAVIPAVIVFVAFWEGHDITPLMVYLGLYLVACIGASAGARRNQRKGIVVHSRYSGTPFLMKLRLFRGKLDEQTAKKSTEPTFVVLVGMVTLSVNEPLGWFLILAGVGLAFSVQLSISYERRQLEHAHDALIEQQLRSEGLRHRDW